MSDYAYNMALRDFRRARQQAALQQVLARLTGKSNALLDYNALQEQIAPQGVLDHGVQEIPLEAIVGSVGRAEDFTRTFLPKHDSVEERWARVRAAVIDMKGGPPIDVYQVGEVYFVKDGNHRVSVARQLGSETISAHVTEVQTRVPLTPDDDPQEVILKARQADFLEKTKLDELRPDSNLQMTFSGQYALLLEQIKAVQRRLQAQRGDEAPFSEAVAAWYDEIYAPVIKLIREQGLARNFPDYTEADLYVLLSERRAELEEALGWQIDANAAATALAEAFDRRPRRALSRLGGRLRDVVVPATLSEDPAPGLWRKRRVAARRERSLFADILVSVQGSEADWRLLDEALQVAQRENGRILALHAVAHEDELQNATTRRIGAEVAARCAAAGVPSAYAAEVGVEGMLMIERAAFADLVATNLTFATENVPLYRISSGVNMLMQRCPRPILVLAGERRSPMDRALLAYDGSPKANEALFVAAYLATRWQTALGIVTVETEYTPASAVERARDYLARHHVADVTYLLREPPIGEAVLATAAALESNLLIMGGFGFRPLLHLMLGSTVDSMLEAFDYPILICR